jgi:hypothetical protein
MLRDGDLTALGRLNKVKLEPNADSEADAQVPGPASIVAIPACSSAATGAVEAAAAKGSKTDIL